MSDDTKKTIDPNLTVTTDDVSKRLGFFLALEYQRSQVLGALESIAQHSQTDKESEFIAECAIYYIWDVAHSTNEAGNPIKHVQLVDIFDDCVASALYENGIDDVDIVPLDDETFTTHSDHYDRSQSLIHLFLGQYEGWLKTITTASTDVSVYIPGEFVIAVNNEVYSATYPLSIFFQMDYINQHLNLPAQ